MNKKEIGEIKKQFTPENCAITRICGCYVDGEKNKRTEMKEAFLSLPEEEMFKYFEILRKTLSGTLGKNLLNLEFPLAAEAEGGAQEFLLGLRNSRLTEDALLEELYDRIIQSYAYGENYLILVIHGAYDIPGKSTDGQELFDASDEVYEYLLCCICPVKLSKPGLYYNTEENCFQTRLRDWIVDAPASGFLFPAFLDRSTDIHNLLYYSKKPEELHEELIQEFLECPLPVSAGGQKENFHILMEETFGEECDYQAVKTVHETLNTWMEEKKEDPEPLELTKAEVRRLFSETGVMDEEKLEQFDRTFEECAGPKGTLLASNVTSTRSFEVKTPQIRIQVNPEYMSLLETKLVDGRLCLVVPVDNEVEVNGMPVRTTANGDQKPEA
ncbi:MAG: DUF4317 domain-containing protein [Lachnospiraceae bacterium]|nr:DUF4317 domain-containing protein [Lachnospiraceae bacterium]MCI9134951.1 DUF4317 domain-containing protein [Lachnospiraceae bacterium]